jgi:signal transduction histidine kinase
MCWQLTAGHRLHGGARHDRQRARADDDVGARRLPPAVDLAAYRIVQEALTNVLRHAGPATAMVRLTYDDDHLSVQVEDDGHGAAAGWPPVGGNGPLGMHERVAALGGRLEAGPRPAGGFRVLATLPWTARREGRQAPVERRQKLPCTTRPDGISDG